MGFMVQRGVAVFDFLGEDALAVIMNPFDEALRQDVQTLVGRVCHFYLALPSEFDRAMDRTKTALEEAVNSQEEDH